MGRAVVEPARSNLESPTSMRLELRVRRISLLEAGHGPVCPDCGSPLDLNQPDEELPSELLAVCGSCRRWFLLGEEDARGEVLLLELPHLSAIGKSLAENPAAPATGRRHSRSHKTH
jgi:hypothetical protein